MKEKELSPEESIDLINTMIGKARKRYTDNSFLLSAVGLACDRSISLALLFCYSTAYEEPSNGMVNYVCWRYSEYGL